MAAGIFISRFAGLIRERVFAHYLGSSLAADAFKAALKIPNVLQNLLGEGVLSASFIPVYSKLLAEEDEKLAGRVAGVFASALILCVSLLVAAGVLLAPYCIDAIAPGFQGEARRLTIAIVRILFPGVGLLVLSAWCLGVLNSHNKFFLSYVAPVFWNIAIIATLMFFGTRLGQADLTIALAWGTVVGAALQIAVQLPFVFRYARHLSFGFDRSLKPVRTILRNLFPVVAGRGVVQFSAYLDQIIASYLPQGAVSTLAYAQTIQLIPISIFGMSIAASELPQMSRETGSDEEIQSMLRHRLERGVRRISFFVIPTIVAFIVVGRQIVAALFETGKFDRVQTCYVWYVLIGSTVGLLAATVGRLYSSGFYALQDTRTPFRFAVVRVFLAGLLGYVFAFPMRWVLVDSLTFLGVPLSGLPGGTASVGTIALTTSAGVAGWVEFLLLRRAMHNRIGSISFSGGLQLSLWGSAIAAGATSILFGSRWIAKLPTSLPLRPMWEGALTCFVFGVVYLGSARLLRVPEASGSWASRAR